MADQQLPPSIQLSRMISSVWIPQTIHAAAALGVADALGSATRPSATVAAAVGAHPGATRRLLRAMVALGLCTHSPDGFTLTPLGACLRSDATDSVRSWALLMGGRMVWDNWARLTDCVRSGDSAPQLIAGKNAFEWLAEHPEEFAVFDRSMQELTARLSGLVAASYDFSAARTVMDVGGGHGALLPAILAANTTLRGIVFDQPHCRPGAEALAERHGTAARTSFVGGDFFAAVPEGADVYLLKSVIHDWDDERSIAILRACRAALRGEARLVIVEMVVPAEPGSSPLDQLVASTDLNMLVATGGSERTEAEYRALCAAAGLAITRILPTPSPFGLIETRPAQ
jgi:hypothetical protein